MAQLKPGPIQKASKNVPLKALVGRRYETAFLVDGSVETPGFDIEYVGSARAPGKWFRQGLQGGFDICEQAFSHYLVAKDQRQPLVAIPVFPSRFFPHFGMFVGAQSSLSGVHELAGTTICVPDFAYNPAVWMRGVLKDQYDVRSESITWLVSSSQPILGDFKTRVSADYTVEIVDTGDPADGLYGFRDVLERGEADAIILPRAPASADCVKPLLQDPYRDARRFGALLGGVPINTVLTLNSQAVHEHPLLPQTLFRACEQALQRYCVAVTSGCVDHVHQDMHLSELRRDKLFPWLSGKDANRSIIDRIIRYCVEQEVIQTQFTVDDLFVALREDARTGEVAH